MLRLEITFNSMLTATRTLPSEVVSSHCSGRLRLSAEHRGSRNPGLTGSSHRELLSNVCVSASCPVEPGRISPEIIRESGFIKRGFPREVDTGTSGPASFLGSKAWSPPSRRITEGLDLSSFRVLRESVAFRLAVTSTVAFGRMDGREDRQEGVTVQRTESVGGRRSLAGGVIGSALPYSRGDHAGSSPVPPIHIPLRPRPITLPPYLARAGVFCQPVDSFMIWKRGSERIIR